MKNIKAIIFDLGAVTLNINCQNTIDAFSKLGIKAHYLRNGEEIAILFPDRVQ